MNKLSLEQIEQALAKMLKERPPTYLEIYPLGPGRAKLIQEEMRKLGETYSNPGFKTLLKDEPK